MNTIDTEIIDAAMNIDESLGKIAFLADEITSIIPDFPVPDSSKPFVAGANTAELSRIWNRGKRIADEESVETTRRVLLGIAKDRAEKSNGLFRIVDLYKSAYYMDMPRIRDAIEWMEFVGYIGYKHSSSGGDIFFVKDDAEVSSD